MDPLWSTTRLMFMASPTASGTTCSTVAAYCEPDESVSVTVNCDASRPLGVEPAWSAIFVYKVTCGYAELSTCDTNIVNGLFGSDEAVAGWLDAVDCCTVVGVWTVPESPSEASSPPGHRKYNAAAMATMATTTQMVGISPMDFFEEALPVEAAPEAGALPPDTELRALPHDEQNASPSLTEAPQWGQNMSDPFPSS